MQDEPQPQAEQPKISVEDMDNALDHLVPEESTSEQTRTVFDRLSDVGLENFQLKQTVAELEQKLRTKDILDGLIEPYAGRAFNFMCVYSGFVGSVLLLDSFNISGFEMDPTVQAYLVGSTAVTVIGLVGMVLTGVFVGARK
ncbi:hypothetical protein [Planktomarina sp.]|uniref:hypothetical protein n=1 Tax=Planktomarina sp. TaxID=2024851 RepID=UPI00233C8898|nr:hypothetical protein [Planktomarina temperata]MDC1262520.1 hypothetical protein [Planktomarina temperata]MDC3368076.1 hypothetical protein [bacterium]